MSFIEKLDSLIPQYLSAERKNRLREALKQFIGNQVKDKNYTDFYSLRKYNSFLQGDLINQLRFPVFNIKDGNYYKKYFNAILISNSCDMDDSNNPAVSKNIIISKIIPFNEYLKDLEKFNLIDIEDRINNIKNQRYTNLIYLPPTKDSTEYIVFLDNLSQITKEELVPLKTDIDINRIEILDYFGYYLFIFKLSYHFCRLPEDQHRNF